MADIELGEKGWIEQFINQKNDVVNHPSHYTQGGIECIDAIKAALGKDGFNYYLSGNILKYVWRYRFKNGIEDLKKAQFYLNCIIESLEKDNTDNGTGNS